MQWCGGGCGVGRVFGPPTCSASSPAPTSPSPSSTTIFCGGTAWWELGVGWWEGWGGVGWGSGWPDGTGGVGWDGVGPNLVLCLDIINDTENVVNLLRENISTPSILQKEAFKAKLVAALTAGEMFSNPRAYSLVHGFGQRQQVGQQVSCSPTLSDLWRSYRGLRWQLTSVSLGVAAPQAGGVGWQGWVRGGVAGVG